MTRTPTSLLLIVLVALLAMLVPGVPALATTPCPGSVGPPWASQAQMRDFGSHNDGCRRNWVTDPGRGRLLDADSATGDTGLLRPDRVAFYQRQGFSTDFLYWGERTTITVQSDDQRRWAACRSNLDEGGVCADGNLKYGAMGDVFSRDVELDVVKVGDAFIALVCGNFFPEGGTTEDDAPTITVTKFRDDDRDGMRDASETTLPGWDMVLRQVSSIDGEPGGEVTQTTGADGTTTFDLSGRTPGTYEVQELVQDGWKAYTRTVRTVVVPPGSGGEDFPVAFGNAEIRADVEKVAMTVDGPATFTVDTPTEVDVTVQVRNNGPAEFVAVRDELEIEVLDDCVAEEPSQYRELVLRRGQVVEVPFTFVVTCTRASDHPARFNDVLRITDPDFEDDTRPANNTLSAMWDPDVHAFTTLQVGSTITCDEQTDVGVPYGCTVAYDVTNDGYRPMDATVTIVPTLEPDCTAEPARQVVALDELGAAANGTVDFAVTCTRRSFHDTAAEVQVTADDRHVFDAATEGTAELVRAAASASARAVRTEVFHDATMAPTDLHLTCDEVLGATTHTCTAVVDYAKSGPAPDVNSVVTARLEAADGCVTDGDVKQQDVVLGPSGTSTFTWTLTCDASDVLHPAQVGADVRPESDPTSDRWEPHAVDGASTILDSWAVPYCLPTVNPHGEREPQAPGNGQNEDGYYVFGMLAIVDGGEQVSIRDDGSGRVFGPFRTGVRIKWVEANGAEPSISSKGSNNGRRGNNGSADAVDHQVRAKGDAQAFFVDERGVEVSVTCLVPNPPK